MTQCSMGALKIDTLVANLLEREGRAQFNRGFLLHLAGELR